MAKKVAVLVGSLRKESLTRKYAQAVISMLPPSLEGELVELDMPLYNQDLDDANTPAEAWTAFRDKLKGADAVLFFTPEYNRTISGALKNAIDVGSRPWGHSVWDGKPAAVVSQSPGAQGGFGANHNTRQAVVFLNVPVMPAPELYIGGSPNYLGEDGSINNDQTRELIGKFVAAFAQWVDANAKK
ncbi:NAD(P)H-dependent oxidoreductase [Pseudoduganella sp. SL102]|uniref:NAD(P)H-dependent oxidoreductase n=1 Tax=Pseudoduganella albidiflava TaxID=321983 RepID=A0A411WRL9_9BURK|nr:MULTISPECIES: NAD(P)H-dependent oxidoreductase [Pseudoduganella]QBH99410.1 NAD(P)H-dependent oxidoreductase [Pseudoduganella albidiflava]WBS02648.1 NAD(P)H-dependent oxidoreductase [Pseudoduganella sp. SL102]GGY44631.1 NADPH-dependent FMN reductase [Pseudoduganella albidiflava]